MGSAGAVEGRVLFKDLPMQLLECWAGIDAELLGQGPPHAIERKQRLCLPS
jgi:hypothetical protein